MFSDSRNGVDQTKELIATYFKGMERGSDPWAERDDGSIGNLSSDILMKLVDSQG
jgi:hypothetical protein